jgi:hypothetical protein
VLRWVADMCMAASFCGGGYGCLDRGDLAQPALLLGFPQPLDEIGVDPFQPRDLSWVDPE